MRDTHNKEMEKTRNLLYQARKLLFEQLHASNQESRKFLVKGLDSLTRAFELVGNSHAAVAITNGKKHQPKRCSTRTNRAREEEASSLLAKAREILKTSDNENLQASAEFIHESIGCISKAKNK